MTDKTCNDCIHLRVCALQKGITPLLKEHFTWEEAPFKFWEELKTDIGKSIGKYCQLNVPHGLVD